MGHWRTHVEQWLAAEQQGQDDAADAAFGHVFAALPAVDPSPAFVSRTVEAAWSTGARRRRVALLVVAATALLAVGASGVVLSLAIDGGGARWLTIAAALGSDSLVSLLSAGATLAGWSAAAFNAAAVVASAIGTPYNIAALTAIELVALAILLMLHRLLRGEVEWRSPRAYCF